MRPRSVAEAFEGFKHLRERGAFARSKGRHGFGLAYGSFWGFECFNSDGKLAWWEAMANLFPTGGFNKALGAIFVTGQHRIAAARTKARLKNFPELAHLSFAMRFTRSRAPETEITYHMLSVWIWVSPKIIFSRSV